jgi:hypothetical protein
MAEIKTELKMRKDKEMRRYPERNSKHLRQNRPIQGYEIRVAGHLDERALDWFGEIRVANRADGNALLSGSIPDQAAMLRVLLRLNDLGLSILSVRAIRRRRWRNEVRANGII